MATRSTFYFNALWSSTTAKGRMYTTGRKLNVVVTSVPRVDGLAAHEARWRRKYIIYTTRGELCTRGYLARGLECQWTQGLACVSKLKSRFPSTLSSC